MSDYLVDRKAVSGEDFHSSNIDVLGYDRASETLYVEFQRSADVYAYEGVKESTFDMLVNADSVGSFYAKHIKGKSNGELVGDYFIELREDAEDKAADSGYDYVVGERVMICFDDKYPGANNVWNGPGTVERVESRNWFIVRTDNDGRQQSDTTGGFTADELTPLSDGGEQGDTKWLTAEAARDAMSVPTPFDAQTLTLNLATPSRYGVKWSNGTLTFEPLFEAMSEADALAQFNAAVTQVMPDASVKILAVTHYFD